MENRVRMLEELSRKQGDQITQIVLNDSRHTEIDQRNMLTLEKLSLSLGHLNDTLERLESGFDAKLNDRFLHATGLNNELSGRLDKATTELETQKTTLGEVVGFVKNARWGLGVLYLLMLSILYGLVNHFFAQWK